MFHSVILSLTFVSAAALPDKSSDDESYNSEDNSDEETIGTQGTQEDTDVNESEVEDLEEDAAANDIMSTKKRATKPGGKSKSPKKPASNSDVEDLTNRTSSLAVSRPIFTHYSARYMNPFNIYGFTEDNRIRYNVEVQTPNLPLTFLRTSTVKEGGTVLEILFACPRWFFEHSYVQHRLGDAYADTHAVGGAFHDQVTQAVHRDHNNADRFVIGTPQRIILPEPCMEGHVNGIPSTWRTRGMEVVNEQTQFQWAFSFDVWSKREHILAQEEQAVVVNDVEL